MTRGEALREGHAAVAASGSPSAGLDVRVLLAAVLDCEPSRLLIDSDIVLEEGALARFRESCRRRCAGEPVAYIIGKRDFYKNTFHVTEAVLIPRPETEHLVEAVLRFFPESRTLLDIGTGSGILPVTLRQELKRLKTCTAVDISPAALAVAEDNAAGILGPAHGIRFMESDIYENVTGSYDLIVSNPPYVTEAEYLEVEAGVRDYEPELALVAGADGLDCYKRIIAGAPEYMEPGGGLVLEVSDATADVCVRLAGAAGLDVIDLLPDLAGHARVLVARKNSIIA